MFDDRGVVARYIFHLLCYTTKLLHFCVDVNFNMQWFRRTVPKFSVFFQSILDAMERAYNNPGKRTKRALRKTFIPYTWVGAKLKLRQSSLAESQYLIELDWLIAIVINAYIFMPILRILTGLGNDPICNEIHPPIPHRKPSRSISVSLRPIY